MIGEVTEGELRPADRFPAEARPEEEFSGGLIEARPDGGYRLYWGAEVAMPRFAGVSVEEFSSRREAVDAFVKESYSEGIDGIALDWPRGMMTRAQGASTE